LLRIEGILQSRLWRQRVDAIDDDYVKSFALSSGPLRVGRVKMGLCRSDGGGPSIDLASGVDFSYFFYIPTYPLGATMCLNEGH
jgi:hypothetical protein